VLQHTATATHCDTLQHAVTHCNTLQLRLTATLCNTRQHTTTHYNTLQHTATHCNTLQHTATHCNCDSVQHFAAHFATHFATHCNTLLHTATHFNTQQHTSKRQEQLAIHTCDMTRSSMYHDSLISVTCLNHVFDMGIQIWTSHHERSYWAHQFQRVAACCRVLQCVAVC